MRALVVDDEPDARLPIVRLLERRGWEVEQAGDGEGCLETCERSRPLAIVLDYKLPTMSGIEVASRLRETGYRGFIVLYSAYLTPAIEDDAKDLGAVAVAKPDLDQLFDLLAELVQGNGEGKLTK